ncbi:MAG: zinc-dependent metalloprotease [Arcanobacterium sp.]|nr:zinc-dependent metalloprotease [Arcanobacterium sp.]
MSFGQNEGNNSEQNWEEMLRSVLGDEALEQIKERFGEDGLAVPEGFEEMLGGQNIMIIGQQIQEMLGSSGEGAVNWKIAEQVARETIGRKYPESLSSADADKARDALTAASLWLDAATEFGPVSGKSAAWSRLDWVAHSLPTFKRLMDPVGENLARAIENAFTEQMGNVMGFSSDPDFGDESGLGGPMGLGGILPNAGALMGKMTAVMLGAQYGNALAQLASSSFGTSDTGLPLIEASTAALVPANVSRFAEDLETTDGEVLAFTAVRELAAARLFTHVPWLRPRVLDTVAEFARGIEINTDAIAAQISEMNLDNPSGVHEIDMNDIFVLELSEAQKDALQRLEHLITLVEGWVNVVAARAVAPHLPNAVPLQEMFTRRYATDNPARQVWEAQLGMTLAPKLLRQSIRFWELAEFKLGATERDALWNHPDLLPPAEKLLEPETFFSDSQDQVSAEIDSFLAELFANESNEESQSHTSETQLDSGTDDETK